MIRGARWVGAEKRLKLMSDWGILGMISVLFYCKWNSPRLQYHGWQQQPVPSATVRQGTLGQI